MGADRRRQGRPGGDVPRPRAHPLLAHRGQRIPQGAHRLRVTTQKDFKETLNQFYGAEAAAAATSNVDDLLAGLDDDGAKSLGGESTDEVSAAADNELVKLVNKVIVDAYNQGASDIHIEPYPGKAQDRDPLPQGRLARRRTSRCRRPTARALVARLKIMCDLDISEKRKPQDGKIKFKKFGPLDIELRVATIPTAGGVEDIVMRILAAGEPIPLEKMGFTAAQPGASCKTRVSKPYGLFFVCGPTGSGKTTTLHSVLKYLNTPDTKIWTAEDPVEITQKGLRQVQVNKKAGLDFAMVMKAFLRADPDIIMVGEMRDKETTAHRHRGLAHRPPGVRHAAHQLGAGIDHPPARHGHGPVQLRRRAARHPGAAPGASACASCKQPYTPDAGRAAPRSCASTARS